MLKLPNSDFNNNEDLARRTKNVRLPRASLLEIFRPGNSDYVSIFELKNPFVIIMYAIDAAYGDLTHINYDELNKKEFEDLDSCLRDIDSLRKRFPHLDMWGKMKPYEVPALPISPWQNSIALCGFCGEDYIKIQRDALTRAGYETYRIIEGTIPFEFCLL